MRLSLKLLGLCLTTLQICSLHPSMRMDPPSSYRMTNELKDLKNQLLSNPASIVAENRTLRQKLWRHWAAKAGCSNSADFNQLFCDQRQSQRLIKIMQQNQGLYEEKNSIYYLDECIGASCPLTRYHNPHYRAYFEQEVAQELARVAQRSAAGSAHVVDFAAGDMFPTLMIVTQALEKGVQDLHVHVLDHQKKAYAEFIAVYGKGVTRSKSDVIFEHIDTAYQEIKDEHKHSKSALADLMRKVKNKAEITTKAEVVQCLLTDHATVSQLSAWAKMHYPRQKCTLYVHKDVQAYEHFLEQHPECVADVLSTCDWDQKALDLGVGDAWDALRATVSQSGKNAITFNLIKPGVFGKPRKPYVERQILLMNDQRVEELDCQEPEQKKGPGGQYKEAANENGVNCTIL